MVIGYFFDLSMANPFETSNADNDTDDDIVSNKMANNIDVLNSDNEEARG